MVSVIFRRSGEEHSLTVDEDYFDLSSMTRSEQNKMFRMMIAGLTKAGRLSEPGSGRRPQTINRRKMNGR